MQVSRTCQVPRNRSNGKPASANAGTLVSGACRVITGAAMAIRARLGKSDLVCALVQRARWQVVRGEAENGCVCAASGLQGASRVVVRCEWIDADGQRAGSAGVALCLYASSRDQVRARRDASARSELTTADIVGRGPARSRKAPSGRGRSSADRQPDRLKRTRADRDQPG